MGWGLVMMSEEVNLGIWEFRGPWTVNLSLPSRLEYFLLKTLTFPFGAFTSLQLC